MRLAEILSDLTSLEVCDHAAARSLVSVRAGPKDTPHSTSIAKASPDSPEVMRAKDLIETHHAVKVSLRSGTGNELSAARNAVGRALQELEIGKHSKSRGIDLSN